MRTEITYFQGETVEFTVSINRGRKIPRPLYWAEIELSNDGPRVTVFRDSLEEVLDVLNKLSKACRQAIDVNTKEGGKSEENTPL